MTPDRNIIHEKALKLLEKNAVVKQTDDLYTCLSQTDETKKYILKRRNGIFHCHCIGYVYHDICTHLEALRIYREDVENINDEDMHLGNLQIYSIDSGAFGTHLGLIKTKLDKDMLVSILETWRKYNPMKKVGIMDVYQVVNAIDAESVVMLPVQVVI